LEIVMSDQAQPQRWYHWVLIYPTLITTVLASIPTYLEMYRSHKHAVGYGESSRAVARNDLFIRNLDCAAAPFDYLVTASNVQVDATICKSGDVFIRGQSPEAGAFYEWVSVEQMTSKGGSAQASLGFNLINSAHAADNGRIQLAQATTVMCQRWIADGKLLRRISVQGRGCFDEVVNTYSGRVESSTPAACNSTC
jgi:hypothetical protein